MAKRVSKREPAFRFDSRYPPLPFRRSQEIRNKFYADWLRCTNLRPRTESGFLRLIGDIEEMVGDWLSDGDFASYDLERTSPGEED